MHLLQFLDYRGMITWCDITVELRLRECYQAMPLEAISEDDWLLNDVGCENNRQLVK